jgi:hypothetical protein
MRDVWNDRPVTFAKITLEEGDAVLEAFEASKYRGSRLLLALSLRYSDTNELVFRSVAEVNVLPFEMLNRIGRLSSKAAYVNGLRDDDPDALPIGNGHDADAAAGPSH